MPVLLSFFFFFLSHSSFGKQWFVALHYLLHDYLKRLKDIAVLKLPSCHALEENEALLNPRTKWHRGRALKGWNFSGLSQDTPRVSEHTGERRGRDRLREVDTERGRGWRRESDRQDRWMDGWMHLAGLHAQLLPGGRLLGLRLGAGIGTAIEG